MTILKDISVLWSLIHTLIMFVLLFESRYPAKKTVMLTASTMIPLIMVNFGIYLLIDTAIFTILPLTCIMPSLIFFWVTAKHRDGRFLFTFCLSDSLSLEIMYITNILDFYIGNNYVFMFAARLLLYPVLELLLWKVVRPAYLEVQQHVTRGWYVFSAISAIFYMMMLLSVSWPSMIMERPEYLPAFVMQLILLPVIYAHILMTLNRQMQHYQSLEKENILQVQVASMRSRIAEFAEANNLFREERHDFRHKMRTVAALAEKGQYEELQAMALEYAESMPEKTVDTYCGFAIVDAVLGSYLEWAQRREISVTAKIDFPASLPVNESELSTVLANAIENAIHACEKIPPEERYIEIKVLREPCFMLQIKNSFDGIIAFNEKQVPISPHESHGFGTRSIVTFCEKNNAFYEFRADGSDFLLKIIFS